MKNHNNNLTHTVIKNASMTEDALQNILLDKKEPCLEKQLPIQIVVPILFEGVISDWVMDEELGLWNMIQYAKSMLTQNAVPHLPF
jgi:hypothetical protein